MVSLDDINIYKKLDASDMKGQLRGLPQQCLDAWNEAIKFKLPEYYRNINKVVVLGMGGSAIAGDLLSDLISDRSRIHIYVNRDYNIPSFIDSNTLIIACSYSGNTEETLSAFEAASKVNCKKIAITAGGKLKEISESARIPLFVMEHKSPPRAALGYTLMPLLAFLSNLGLLKGMVFNIEAMANNLKKLSSEWGIDVNKEKNLAKKIAFALNSKIAVIYADGCVAAAARRWKTQINENAKAWAFYEELPELNHNAIVGYQFPAEIAGKIFVVFLRTISTDKRMLVRYAVTAELLRNNNIDFTIVDAKGVDDLSRLMSLVYLGDWVSYYLSILYGIDPTPVKVIDYLKKKLHSFSE